MYKLEIVTWPSEILTTRAAEVTEFDKDLPILAKRMHETMEESYGIGLAANQVGLLKRIIVIHIPYQEGEDAEDEPRRPWHDKKFTLVNPVIVEKKGRIKMTEGCLSFPEIYEYIDRAGEITVKAKDEFGNNLLIEADGLFSVCLQHEIDHIDGIVFINRMSRLKAQLAKRKLQKAQLMNHA